MHLVESSQTNINQQAQLDKMTQVKDAVTSLADTIHEITKVELAARKLSPEQIDIDREALIKKGRAAIVLCQRELGIPVGPDEPEFNLVFLK